MAEIIPLHKKGNVCKTTNYRPILLLSQFHKLFEKVIHTRLISYLAKYNLLNEHQFGFHRNYSTIMAIKKLYDQSIKNIDLNLYS